MEDRALFIINKCLSDWLLMAWAILIPSLYSRWALLPCFSSVPLLVGYLVFLDNSCNMSVAKNEVFSLKITATDILRSLSIKSYINLLDKFKLKLFSFFFFNLRPFKRNQLKEAPRLKLTVRIKTAIVRFLAKDLITHWFLHTNVQNLWFLFSNNI